LRPDIGLTLIGVGAKTAASLLRKHGSLDVLLSAGRFPAQADDLRLYKRLARMDASAPLPGIPDQSPTWARAASLAQTWELNRLAERLNELAAQAPVEPQKSA
jgi:DNA polymerase-1